MKDTTTAVIRTTWFASLLTLVASLASRWTNTDVKVEDLAPWTPLIAGVLAVVYRAALFVAARWNWVGVILFGKSTTPSYE